MTEMARNNGGGSNGRIATVVVVRGSGRVNIVPGMHVGRQRLCDGSSCSDEESGGSTRYKRFQVGEQVGEGRLRSTTQTR